MFVCIFGLLLERNLLVDDDADIFVSRYWYGFEYGYGLCAILGLL
jgi:hypothetical protein